MLNDKNSENLVVRDDESEFEDFDGDDTMENLLSLFLFNRKDAVFLDWVSLLSFIMFLCVNVGCASFNLYKAITEPTDELHDDMLNDVLHKITLYNSTSMLNSTFDNCNMAKTYFDKPTKILYIIEFSVIALFFFIAIYNYILLAFNPLSKTALSNAANFTRLVREFSCFTLVPLFNISTITGIYNDIAKTFEEEQKKYSDRSELWDGIWGISTKDVQKTNTIMELAVDNDRSEDTNEEESQDENNQNGESKFKKFKRSKTFLRIVSIFIYMGFILSLISVLLLACFAFVALYIKTRHVGNFIRSQGNFTYKWFNFITFIMNIASLSQQSPAIKLIIYQLKILTKKAHINKYRRRKQNRIKENAKKFDADEDAPGIQPPKIIIHKKKISRTMDDSEIEVIKAQGMEEIDTDRLSPPSLKRQNSKLSTKSTNSL